MKAKTLLPSRFGYFITFFRNNDFPIFIVSFKSDKILFVHFNFSRKISVLSL